MIWFPKGAFYKTQPVHFLLICYFSRNQFKKTKIISKWFINFHFFCSTDERLKFKNRKATSQYAVIKLSWFKYHENCFPSISFWYYDLAANNFARVSTKTWLSPFYCASKFIVGVRNEQYKKKELAEPQGIASKTRAWNLLVHANWRGLGKGSLISFRTVF